MILTPAITIYALGFIGIILCLLAFFIIRTNQKLGKFMRGKDAKSLEVLLNEIVKELHDQRKEQEDIKAHLGHVEKRLRKSIQGVDLVRFNPFTDSGSNQSFAISFLNEHGDGVVLSSLYARDRMSIFAKKIKNLGSEHELSDEEKLVITNAGKTMKK